jgi:hypothetical protein
MRTKWIFLLPLLLAAACSGGASPHASQPGTHDGGGGDAGDDVGASSGGLGGSDGAGGGSSSGGSDDAGGRGGREGGASPDGGSALIAVPLGGYVGTWLGDTGSQYYSSYSDHWTAFGSAMGRPPTLVGLPGTPYPAQNPDQWPTQSQYNVSNWPSVLPKTTIPMLTIWYVDANSNPLFASATDGTTYSGQDVDYWIAQMLQPYADFGIKKIYLRPAWEWNTGFMGQSITGVGAATYVTAMQHFYTAAHAWGTANDVTVRVAWNPSVYGQDTNGIALAAQFPNQKPGDHYVDVIAADFYAFGNSLASQPVGGPTVFTLTALVAMSQQWNLPLGFCELGDGLYMNGDPTTVWMPDLVRYVGTLSTASPPVPVEFMTLWDVQSIEWTPPQVNRADELAGWQAALGASGSLRTLPVP